MAVMADEVRISPCSRMTHSVFCCLTEASPWKGMVASMDSNVTKYINVHNDNTGTCLHVTDLVYAQILVYSGSE